jgi:NADH-quinone oxidoreductase subunit H
MEIINFDNLKYFFILVLYVLAIIGPLLIAVAFLTYLERKVIALVQYRKGPNVVGFFGLLQPFADGVKLFSKETIIPASSSKLIFVLAPMISFSLSLIAWSVIPVSENIVLSNRNFIPICSLIFVNIWYYYGRVGK